MSTGSEPQAGVSPKAGPGAPLDVLSDLGVPLDFGFDDADLDAVLSGDAGAQPVPDMDLAPSEDLRELSRRIAGQYADVVASFASQAFAGRAGEASLAQARSALASLRRLAEAAADPAVVAVLNEFDRALATPPPKGGRARQKYLDELRDLILRFADHLSAADGERLRQTVTFDRKALPLLDELAALPGMGPKRLERLYCAGLFTVESVSAADPEEIALVTGLPRPLAHTVVEATRRFADEQRKRVLQELQQRASELSAMLRGLPGDTSADLLTMARSAFEDLRVALEQVDKGAKKK